MDKRSDLLWLFEIAICRSEQAIEKRERREALDEQSRKVRQAIIDIANDKGSFIDFYKLITENTRYEYY